MTDINTRGKLPFTVVSSSVNTGYAADLTASVGQNINIVNYHKDEYGQLEGVALQGPFSNQHVGGNQHRHVNLNDGADNSNNRPEAFILSASANSIKVYGPDINGADKPRAILTRGNTAKSPINISNIETSGNIAGNFEHNYQVVQSVGRRTTNNLIVDGFVASGNLTTQFVTGTQTYSLPEITDNSKSIFVERFNAPGGKQESSRGTLDREGEEYSPNNSLVTRNIKVRQPYYNQLTQHSAQFNSGSTYKLLPDTGSVIATTIHAVNRNTLQKIVFTGSSPSTGSKYDNFWVQHAIPATDLRYKWIADSISSSQQPIEYQSYNLPYSTSSLYNSNNAFNDLSFELTGPFGDHLGISGAIDKDELFVSTHTDTMYRDRKQFRFFGGNGFYIDLSQISSDISKRDFSISFWAKIPSSMPANGPYTFLQYSGSLGENQLKFYCITSEALSSWAIENSTIPSEYQTENYEQTSNFNDDKWHLITVTSDKTTLLPRINGATAQVLDTTLTKVYVDGGLVYEKEQKFTNFDITKVCLRTGLVDAYDNTLIDDIIIWDKTLSEQQILNCFRVSKTSYGDRPKKFIEHKFNNISDLQPIHVYSTRTQDIENILFDEVGTKNAILVNYTSSVNLYPQLNKTISYSTYFNGPYQASNWKFTRNNEHPITRKLTTEDTNIVVNDFKNGNKKRIKESPVYINNKPLKHRIKLKNSQNQNSGFEIVHSYGNNLQYFADKDFNNSLGLSNKTPQMYDKLLAYYSGRLPEEENPIENLVGYTYSETIFPKSTDAGLKETRMRTDYITDQPGFSADGYDRQLGTQRVFWRDSQEDRMRTRRNYITSLGEQLNSEYDLPFQTPSIAALEQILDSKNVEYYTSDSLGRLKAYVDFAYSNSSELNNKMTLYFSTYALPSNKYVMRRLPAVDNMEIYFYRNNSLTNRDDNNVIIQNSGTYPNVNLTDPSSLRVRPKYIFEHPASFSEFVDSNYTQSLFLTSSWDLGLNRYTELISKKQPWYDDYKDYYEDVKNLSNDNLISYSKIPEFIISQNIKDLIVKHGGNKNKIILNSYVDNLDFSLRPTLEQQNDNIVKQDTINLKIKGIKKLLPYNGFYPQDRSLQLVNHLKESYLDTDAVKGGLLLVGDDSSISGTYYEGQLETYLKTISFLEPLFAPGIFYNLIKSGIAVDWTIYTGSIPQVQDSSNAIVALNKPPNYKIPFETLLDLTNGFPVSSSQLNNNRFIKYKELDLPFNAGDYGLNQNYSFQGFFELENKFNEIYSLSINNFLAETINFFLKDSKLNSFISKPEEQFKTFQSGTTYYMDVILRNEGVIMVDGHSSSIGNNYGKMRGNYFGPSFFTGSTEDISEIISGGFDKLFKTQLDPSYCLYTPPYFYGDSIARISFTPDVSRKYSLEEIFSGSEVDYFNKGLLDDSIYPSGSLYNNYAMNVGASIQLFGSKRVRNLTVSSNNTLNLNGISEVTRQNPTIASTGFIASDDNMQKQWTISTKMEVPILDFSNQEYIVNNNIIPLTSTDSELTSLYPLFAPPTASGFGIGMWSGYGEIPSGQKGIFMELKESHPDKLLGSFDFINNRFGDIKTGSLIQACGFQVKETSKKLGEIADSREISEAIIIIPYSDKVESPKNIRLGYSVLGVNDTVEIEGKNFYKINKQIYDYQLNRIGNNPSGPVVNLQDFTQINGSIQETSISKMIKTMSNYVLPPNFDFLLNKEVQPFVMYIAEFTSTLDKQDLADIWQGVMPKIATRAEREEQIISHKNTTFDFFHGQGLPKDVKFMIFKAKKRAQISYYKMTEDSTDDGLFPTIQAGKTPSPYSFNWPYDYCSLVETARVDVEIDYINLSGSNDI